MHTHTPLHELYAWIVSIELWLCLKRPLHQRIVRVTQWFTLISFLPLPFYPLDTYWTTTISTHTHTHTHVPETTLKGTACKMQWISLSFIHVNFSCLTCHPWYCCVQHKPCSQWLFCGWHSHGQRQSNMNPNCVENWKHEPNRMNVYSIIKQTANSR